MTRRNPLDALEKRLVRLRARGVWIYVPTVAAGAALFAVVVFTLLEKVFGIAGHNTTDPNTWSFRLSALIVAPLLETVLQIIPGVFVYGRRVGGWAKWLILVTPFAALHWWNGLRAFITAGLIGGIWLAATFLVGIRRSFAEACWLTALTHATYNAIILSAATAL